MLADACTLDAEPPADEEQMFYGGQVALEGARPRQLSIHGSRGGYARRHMKITVEMQIRELVRKIVHWRPGRVRKLVLCRPRGGLNDMLCQIDKCRLYSIRHHRDLWIDTSRSGFHDCLSNYFEPSREFHFGSPLPEECDHTSCFPTFLAHKLDTYESSYDFGIENHVDRATGKPLTFDFGCRYKETILLHEQCGGGDKSIMVLALLRLKKDAKQQIRQTIDGLGKYDAIHVRNSDLTTDYKKWLGGLYDQIRGKVVVCTDDFRCHQYAKELWGHRLAEIHPVPDMSGAPLHGVESANQRALNMNVLVDLFVLACAENYYATETDQGRVSGFGRLAESLRSNPRILRELLD